MQESFSPYALLKASIPKKPNTLTTSYDLFSTSAQGIPPYLPPTDSSPVSSSSLQETSPSTHNKDNNQAYALSRPRTHYIADIQSRHNAANMRSSRLIKR